MKTKTFMSIFCLIQITISVVGLVAFIPNLSNDEVVFRPILGVILSSLLLLLASFCLITLVDFKNVGNKIRNLFSRNSCDSLEAGAMKEFANTFDTDH